MPEPILARAAAAESTRPSPVFFSRVPPFTFASPVEEEEQLRRLLCLMGVTRAPAYPSADSPFRGWIAAPSRRDSSPRCVRALSRQS